MVLNIKTQLNFWNPNNQISLSFDVLDSHLALHCGVQTFGLHSIWVFMTTAILLKRRLLGTFVWIAILLSTIVLVFGTPIF